MKSQRSMINSFVLACAMAVAVALSACGSVTPSTFNQKLSVAVAANTEVRATASTLLAAGKISATDAQNIQNQANTAREGLDVARSLRGTDLTSADHKLEAANAILRALQTYLLTKQGAK